MNNQKIKEIKRINEEYKALKLLEPIIVYRSNYLSINVGVILMPFVTFFIFILNSFLKFEFLNSNLINNSNEYFFVLFLIVSWIIISTFWSVSYLYCSYYFKIKNMTLKKINKECIEEINSIDEYQKILKNKKIEARKIIE